MNLKFDPSAPGLAKVFTDYQILAMGVVWEGEGVGSRIVHRRVNEMLSEGRSVSRASIINFLNKMVDQGVLNYVEESVRGGFRRVYSSRLDVNVFPKELAKSIISSLMRDFPDETREVINSYL